MSDESRRQRWDDHADWPLTIAAVLFLIAYAAPILKPDLVSPLPAICQLVTWAAWALFAVDYFARLGLSRDRTAFMRANLLDLAVVVLPLLRPLRLLRLVTLLSVLNRNVGGAMRGRGAGTALLWTLLRVLPALPMSADVLAGNRKGEVFYERRGFVARETMEAELFGEPVVERRWWRVLEVDPAP